MKKNNFLTSFFLISTITISLLAMSKSVLALECDDFTGYCAPHSAPLILVKGRVESIMISESGSAQFRLVNQPTEHPFCDISRFMISQDDFIDIVKEAKLRYRQVLVSYNPAGGCTTGFPRVWSVGLE